jgi:hypothetical protein
MKNEMMATIPREPIPMSLHWRINSFQYIRAFSGLEIMLLSIKR